MSNELKEKVFYWLSFTFTYIAPALFTLYTFVIEKVMDNKVSIVAKIGMSGIFLFAVLAITAIFLYNKYLIKKIEKIRDKMIESTDINEKLALKNKKHKLESRLDIFHNIIFITPFILMYLMLVMAENWAISMRGTMGTICISMAIGLGLNGVKQWLHIKGEKTIDEQNNE